MRDIKKIVIHCAATPPDMDIGAPEIRQWHLERGWDDIGYHYVIKRGGGVDFGRARDRSGAHVRGHNLDSIGICLVGGLNEARKPDANYTRKQLSALERIVNDLLREYPGAEVMGHRDLDPGKDCPCFDAGAWWYGKGEANA